MLSFDVGLPYPPFRGVFQVFFILPPLSSSTHTHTHTLFRYRARGSSKSSSPPVIFLNLVLYQAIVISLLIIKLSSSRWSRAHNSQYIRDTATFPHQPCTNPPSPPFDRSFSTGQFNRLSIVPTPPPPSCRNIDVHTRCCVHRLCLNCGETKLENLTASTCHLSVVKIERE